MNKGSHFNGQPAYGQLINLLDKSKILQISQEKGGERYVKHSDAWQHLLIMLYAVIKRFDSLREITDSMFPEARKLAHLHKRDPGAVLCLTQMHAGQRESLRQSIATCTRHTATNFHRTAETIHLPVG